MKMVLAAVTFAALTASPVLARSLGSGRTRPANLSEPAEAVPR
jgi:hypothetical protein